MPGRIAALLLALLAGCQAHLGTGFSVGTPGVPPPSASVSVQGGPALGWLIALGIVIAAAREEDAGPLGFDPAPDPARRVNEQDCTKPIADPAANLRCR